MTRSPFWLHSGFLTRAIGLTLLAAIVAAYWQSLFAGFIDYDDHIYVWLKPEVLQGLTWNGAAWAFTSLSESNWHPLTWLSLMLDSQFFFLYAPGYRMTNLLLHWGNALLVFLLLRRATGRLWEPALAAALFALHPQHVESVAWISERKDVLSTFFWLLTMVAYLRYCQERSRTWYATALVLFVLGNMAKQMLVTLPCALLLFDLWPLARFGPAAAAAGPGPGRLLRSLLPPARLLWEKVPFFLVSAAAAAVALQAQTYAMAPLSGLPAGVRAVNALASYLQYLKMTVYPVDLAVFYPHPGSTLGFWTAAGSGLFLALVTGLALAQVRTRPYLLVGWLWFLGVLVPVIGLVQIGSQGMADRYVYVPHIGLFTAAAFGASDLARRFAPGPRAAAAGALLVLAALGVLTFRQAGRWADSQQLFLHAARVTERNTMAHVMVATSAAGKKDWPLYQEHYLKAVELDPHFVSKRHAEWGYNHAVRGNVRGALAEFVQALEIDPKNSLALLNLAVLYGTLGRYDAAELALLRALDAEPGHRLLVDALAEVRAARERTRARLAAGRGLPNGNTTAGGPPEGEPRP